MSCAPPHDRARLHAVVYGLVQGVNFRSFTAARARQLGLSGSVRNLPDGRSVEVEAEGERAVLERLLDALHQGPRFARVERVDATWHEPLGVRQGFHVLP